MYHGSTRKLYPSSYLRHVIGPSSIDYLVTRFPSRDIPSLGASRLPFRELWDILAFRAMSMVILAVDVDIMAAAKVVDRVLHIGNYRGRRGGGGNTLAWQEWLRGGFQPTYGFCVSFT